VTLARKHPVANWLRLPPGEQRRALDQVLALRDAGDPMASGLPPAAVDWFWSEELPLHQQGLQALEPGDRKW